MSTGCIDRRKHKKTPPHLNHSSKHTISFQGVTSSEEGEPILLDPDPAKYWHDICTVPLGPYSRVKLTNFGRGEFPGSSKTRTFRRHQNDDFALSKVSRFDNFRTTFFGKGFCEHL